MLSRRTDLEDQYIIGDPSAWIKPFDINQYVNSPYFIEKLWEEKQLLLTENLDLRNKIANSTIINQYLELEKIKLLDAVNNLKEINSIILLLSVLETVLIGLGVNFVTNDYVTKGKSFLTGIVLIILGILVQGFVIYLSRRINHL